MRRPTIAYPGAVPLQLEYPGPAARVPGAHSLHVFVFPIEYDPAGHSLHAVPLKYVPGRVQFSVQFAAAHPELGVVRAVALADAHVRHELAPTVVLARYVPPKAHTVHALLPVEFAAVPPGQRVHADAAAPAAR